MGFTCFDELCLGELKKYSYNLVDLGSKSTRERVDALTDKIHETITSLEYHSEKKIQHFCIGKTYAEAKVQKAFNANKVATWRLRGISDRWRSTYKKRI